MCQLALLHVWTDGLVARLRVPHLGHNLTPLLQQGKKRKENVVCVNYAGRRIHTRHRFLISLSSRYSAFPEKPEKPSSSLSSWTPLSCLSFVVEEEEPSLDLRPPAAAASSSRKRTKLLKADVTKTTTSFPLEIHLFFFFPPLEGEPVLDLHLDVVHRRRPLGRGLLLALRKRKYYFLSRKHLLDTLPPSSLLASGASLSAAGEEASEPLPPLAARYPQPPLLLLPSWGCNNSPQASSPDHDSEKKFRKTFFRGKKI